jgi:pyrimidine nucleoside transport protein
MTNNDNILPPQVFPIIIYFSAVTNVFYYWGLMQFVVCKIAWLMQFTMGTTAIESLNAACNIFIGMVSRCIPHIVN